MRRSNARTAVPGESNPTGHRPPAAKRRARRETFTRPDAPSFRDGKSRCQTKVQGRHRRRVRVASPRQGDFAKPDSEVATRASGKNSPAPNGIAQQEFRSITKRCEIRMGLSRRRARRVLLGQDSMRRGDVSPGIKPSRPHFRRGTNLGTEGLKPPPPAESQVRNRVFKCLPTTYPTVRSSESARFPSPSAPARRFFCVLGLILIIRRVSSTPRMRLGSQAGRRAKACLSFTTWHAIDGCALECGRPGKLTRWRAH